MRWRRPSLPYVIAILVVLALSVLFITNDWLAVSRQSDRPPASRSSKTPHLQTNSQERPATTRTSVETLAENLASKISAANGLRCVIVVDEAGRPVRAASVAPVSLSINGETRKTDAEGKAWVPQNVSLQPTRWINVRKVGFEAQQVDVPTEWPLRVTLVAEMREE